MVRPDKILKELSALWVDLGHQQEAETPDGAGVLRACAMTLITIVNESEDPSNVGETVAMLMKDHPSRSVLVRLRAGGDDAIESRVFAQCWMPHGQRRQICCEQIEITASPQTIDDIPGVVLPLTVPDLPVILWSRSPQLFETSAFPQIAAMCDKLVVDANAFDNVGSALSQFSKHIGGGRLLADLAWTRLTRWRQTISQIFINRECMEALGGFSKVQVQYGTPAPRGEALYLAAWLQKGFTAAGSKVAVELKPTDGPALAGVVMSGAAGAECDIAIKADKSGSVEIGANKLVNRTIYPEITDYLALLEELSITARDPEFEASLPLAQALAAKGPVQ